ncbi:hypothetical protein [Streptomyces sp. NBC_00358]|uniref:hypothetical protein n=1 Tax=Streptomyces sp. NBC_00358 TaxID=2975725 RepID=UPI002E269D6E
MSAPEPAAGEPARDGLDPAVPGAEAGQPRYEPPPSVGKLLIWVLLFVLAAVVVVLGGVYFT